MDIMDYMMSVPEKETAFSTVENGREVFMKLNVSTPEKETTLPMVENEVSFSDTENRFILAEILKASNIETNHLVNFVMFHHVEPDWHCVNVPDGRTIQQCIAAAKALLGERMPQLPLKRNLGKILLERAPKKSRDWAPTRSESDDIFNPALGKSRQVSNSWQPYPNILSPTLLETASSLSKEKGSTDDKPSEPSSVTEPFFKYLAPSLNTIQTFKQVGLSRIRIELLSLLDQRDAMDPDVNDVSGVSSPEPDEDGCVKDNDNDDHSTGESVGSEAAANGAASGAPAQPSSTSGNTRPSQGSSGRNEEGGGRGGSGRRRRRRQGSRPPDTRAGLQRFACTYDVYHGTRDCLRRGPRNRTGGCDGIYRLKQHLRRRHMMSYRCQRCWISRDTIRQAREHHQQSTCNPRPMPANERFMEPQQENEVETCCGSMPEEDAWWRIFQVLIPHMQTRDVSSLKTQYYPYYVDVSLVIPAVNLYDVSFQPMQVGSTSELSGSNANLPPGPPPSGPSMSQAAPALWSQTISMPVYGLNPYFGQTPTVPPVPSLPQPGTTDTAPQPADSSPEPREPNTAPSTAFPSGQTPPLPSSSPMDGLSRSQQTDVIQLRRNYERLRVRNSQAEADIMEFREANRAYLEDISRADMILEEIFALDDIPDEIYRRLSQVSEILVLATRRLR